MDWAQLGDDAIKIGLGALVTGLGSYILFGRDIAFIKGQLTLIMGRVSKAEENEKKLVVHELQIDKLQSDCNQAHSKIRSIQGGGK